MAAQGISFNLARLRRLISYPASNYIVYIGVSRSGVFLTWTGSNGRFTGEAVTPRGADAKVAGAILPRPLLMMATGSSTLKRRLPP